MYHQQIEEVTDIEKSHQWLEKTRLKDNIKAQIMETQEQALGTSSLENGIYHTREDPRCKLCIEAPETIHHSRSEDVSPTFCYPILVSLGKL